MARTDDYTTNDSGHLGPFHILLDEIPLNFYSDIPLRGRFGPGKTSAEGGEGETSLIFNNFSNGMGMGYSGIENTYAYTIDGYMRSQRKFMPGGKRTEISLDGLGFSAAELAGEIRCIGEWGGDLYIGAGRHILKLTGGTGSPTDEYAMGVDVQIDSFLNYNNIPLFSTDQTADNWHYLTGYNVSAGAWQTAHLTGSPADGAANPVDFTNPVYLQKMVDVFQDADGVGGYRLIGNDSSLTYTQIVSSVFNTIIGDTTAYGASLLCGTTSYAITNIIPTNRIFFIIKADGAYAIENAGIYCPSIVTDLKTAPSLYNGISGNFFNGRLLVGTPQGVLMVDVSNKERQDVPIYVSPSYFLANETPVFGIPTAMTTDGGWNVVSLWNGVDSHLCYMRPRENTQATFPNPYIWHGSECTIPGERITALYRFGLTGRPMMLIGTHNGTRMRLYVLSLPTEGDPYMDFLHGDGHEFSLTSKLYLPFQDAGDPNAKKVIRRFDVQADGLTVPVIDPDTGEVTDNISCAEIDFFANADAGSRIFFEDVEPEAINSEWDFQGTATVSPKVTLLPSLESTSGSQIGVVLVSELLNQGSEEIPVYSPFAVRSIKIRTDVIVEQIERIEYDVQLSDQKATKTGRDFSDIRLKLIGLAALQDADAVYMINEWKERILVKVEPGITYQVRRERDVQNLSVFVHFAVRLLGRQFYWDIGHTYDSVYSWGP